MSYIDAPGDAPRSTLISRNIVVGRKRTSVRLEPEMWVALFDIARREQQSIHDICTLIDQVRKQETSLTAAIRVFVMSYFREAATEDGHEKAGHGNGKVTVRLLDHTRNKARNVA